MHKFSKKTTRVSVIIIFLFSLSFCGCFKPNFSTKKWKSLKIQYGFIRAKNDIVVKTITISGPELDSLKNLFKPKEIRRMSVGNSSDSQLILDNGEVWSLFIRDPQEISLCLEPDDQYHYAMTMNDQQFYAGIRDLCWKQELTITSDVRIENICVCIGGKGVVLEEDALCQPYLRVDVPVQGISPAPKTLDSDANSEEKSETNSVDANDPVDKSNKKD